MKTVCTDEKTGIQALERKAADLPMQAGRVRKQEYEYERHGTKCLIANFEVVTGKIISPSITDTRTEADFEAHIERTIKSDPAVKKWQFVTDQLNTHQSESLVRLVSRIEGIPDDSLGKKGISGILENKKTRAEFLSNEQHSVYFTYTPKHCSWLNQVEIWFGVLCRKLLKRGNFSSKEDLEQKIERFIAYFNIVLAKPYKWIYDGKPCKQ